VRGEGRRVLLLDDPHVAQPGVHAVAQGQVD
jgi:hypothetical protein